MGELIQEAGAGFVNVTPETIQGFYDFVPVDGTLPVDRFAQANVWKELFQTILAVPQIGQQYDLGRIFAWVAQLAGLKNINKFKVQMMDPAVAQAQAQAGNLVPVQAGVPATTQPDGSPSALPSGLAGVPSQ